MGKAVTTTATLVLEVGDDIVVTETCPTWMYPLGVHFAMEQVRWETGMQPKLVLYEEH